MKQLTCEMCGSTDLVKQEGMFVCQSCGTKYSVEEAKKMMIEGTVDVSGSTVKVDNSNELKNLYQVARRAREADNSENAAKYYDMILVKDPSSWEATFYTVYYQSMSCKIAQIQSAAIAVLNCEETVLNLIKENIPDEEERKKVVAEITDKLITISNMLFYGAKNHFDGIGYEIRANYVQEYVYNGCAAREILYGFGNNVISILGEEYAKDYSVPCWKAGIEQHKLLMPNFSNKEINKNMILEYANKIKKYDESYEIPTINATGCYVATCVYGSYDCPEVWTLRRYRDNTLATTWYGRAFIHTYYAISPTIVKWFGDTKWFKNMWKDKLDKKVRKLQLNGVEDTPYIDREW